MMLRVTHRTAYRYAEEVTLSHDEVCLTPRSTPTQECLEHRFEIKPKPNGIHSRIDAFGNVVAAFSVEEPHRELQVTATSRVRLKPVPLPLADGTVSWERVRAEADEHRDVEAIDAHEFLYASPLVPCGAEYSEYASSSFAPGRPFLDALLDLTRRIHHDFRYETGATQVHTSVAEVFERRRGVCQDFAHLEIACLRSLGLPARYVSGYLETVPPPGKPKLIGVDASHAWVSAWLPEFGWIDVDPTNNLTPTTTHVTLAWGRDYSDVAPVRGVVFGCGEHRLEVSVDVART